jgi:hypothetical protein
VQKIKQALELINLATEYLVADAMVDHTLTEDPNLIVNQQNAKGLMEARQEIATELGDAWDQFTGSGDES